MPLNDDNSAISLKELFLNFSEKKILGFNQHEPFPHPEDRQCHPGDYRRTQFYQFEKEQGAYLSFSIERFMMTDWGPMRINRKVQIPQGFTLKSSYHKLYGLICHHGSLESGHYWAYIKGPGERWFRLDDDKVTQVKFKHLLQEGARVYMAFYERDQPK